MGEGRLCYLVTDAHAYTMGEYLRTWGRPLRSRIEVVPYGTLLEHGSLRGGVCVFSDIERLSDPQVIAAGDLAELLRRRGWRVLNDPRRVMCRLALLRALHEAGRNHFRAFPSGEVPADVRFPVFLREEHEHTGALTGLLADRPALARAMVRARSRGFRARDLLVVEQMDVSDDRGLWRKYAMFRFDDRVIARHLFFDEHWVVKGLSRMNDARVEEEREFVLGRTMHAWARGVFRLAGIEYGRIDFGMRGERPQVWEINTNPMITSTQNDTQAIRLELQALFAARSIRAFRHLAQAGHERSTDVDESISRRLVGATGRPRLITRVRRAAIRRTAGVVLSRVLGSYDAQPHRPPISRDE